MRRASVLSGVAFRSALLFLVVFAVVLGVAGFAILKATQAAMDEQIRSAITEDVELLHDANIAGGEAELISFIHDSLTTRSDKQFAFGLFSLGGRPLAGNIEMAPHFRGWGFIEHEIGQSPNSRFLGFAEVLDDDLIVVGRSTAFMTAISRTILNALILSGIVIVAAALGIGYVLNHGVSRKLEVIDTTLGEVARGNSDVRLPVGRSNDQIDHVSRQINAHLDRLSEFMANMRNTIVAIAHDLKSPLNRAYIVLQDAAAEIEPDKAAEKLGQATAEMDVLRDVLDTVLRISRIETSDDSSGFSVFSGAELLRDLMQTFEPVIETAGQTLRCGDFPADGAPIFGDRKMVEQMLVNLIENASRYAGMGATIELAAAAESGTAKIVVADNGPGIAPEQREDVFRPFRRLNPERNLPGAGLGLALVKAIATRHRAWVELGDNRPGLRVTLTLPAAPDVDITAK
jgi:signal transduction histidine kinase